MEISKDKCVDSNLLHLKSNINGVQTYFQSSGAVGKTFPDLVVIMQPSMSNPAIWRKKRGNVQTVTHKLVHHNNLYVKLAK